MCKRNTCVVSYWPDSKPHEVMVTSQWADAVVDFKERKQSIDIALAAGCPVLAAAMDQESNITEPEPVLLDHWVAPTAVNMRGAIVIHSQSAQIVDSLIKPTSER